MVTEWWLKCDWNPPFPSPFSRHSATIQSQFSRLKDEISVCEIYSTYLRKWWKSDKSKRKNLSKEKNTCVKYMELQSTKFIFIGQLPVWYLEVSLFSINYFVISTAGALIITEHHIQSTLRLGLQNWDKWGFNAPRDLRAFRPISDWKTREM